MRQKSRNGNKPTAARLPLREPPPPRKPSWRCSSVVKRRQTSSNVKTSSGLWQAVSCNDCITEIPFLSNSGNIWFLVSNCQCMASFVDQFHWRSKPKVLLDSADKIYTSRSWNVLAKGHLCTFRFHPKMIPKEPMSWRDAIAPDFDRKISTRLMSLCGISQDGNAAAFPQFLLHKTTGCSREDR